MSVNVLKLVPSMFNRYKNSFVGFNVLLQIYKFNIGQ